MISGSIFWGNTYTVFPSQFSSRWTIFLSGLIRQWKWHWHRDFGFGFGRDCSDTLFCADRTVVRSPPPMLRGASPSPQRTREASAGAQDHRVIALEAERAPRPDRAEKRKVSDKVRLTGIQIEYTFLSVRFTFFSSVIFHFCHSFPSDGELNLRSM